MKKNTWFLSILMAFCMTLSACAPGYYTGDHADQTDDNATASSSVPPVISEPPAAPKNPATSKSIQRATLSDEEWKLYQLMMSYRKSKGLPSIPLSNALTVVAQAHCQDLVDNPSTLNDRCNLHSWSDKGSWSGCCYTSDHSQSACMWNKPSELTSYKGYGFEISYGATWANVTTAEAALKSWQGSSGHNNVILNVGMWNSKWNAVGIGIRKGFAMVWFGNDVDSEGAPELPPSK